MESEKVKDIKKVLEEGQFNTIKHHQHEGKPILISFADILTLINELESENERLTEEKDLYKKQFNELEPRFFDLREENQQFKDRIAELEKQMCRNEDLHTATEKLNDEIVLNKFAEMLKENFRKNNLESVIWFSNLRIVDKTLKEFLKRWKTERDI